MTVTRNRVLDIAMDLRGSPCIKYVPNHPEYGMSPAEGFDCSGFVTFVLQQAGISIQDYLTINNEKRQIRHTNEYFDHFGVYVEGEHAQIGDLIFFSSNGWTPTHIGIVSSDNTYIHAPGKDGAQVCVEQIIPEPIVPKVVDGHRVLYTNNPIGFKALTVIHGLKSYRVHQRVL